MSIRWDSSWPGLAGGAERRRALAYLEERFGIPARIFDGYLFFRRRRNWLILKYSEALPSAAVLKITKTGLRAFRDIGAFMKPSTRLIQLFGGYATRARLEIDPGQLSRLMGGEELALDLDIDPGYIILELRDSGILGLGFYINGRLRSQLPVKEIRPAMLAEPGKGPPHRRQAGAEYATSQPDSLKKP